MVFIYPKEGSPQHDHSAALVQADWVTADQAEAAQQWIAYLLEDPQQQAFMQEGFRPGTAIPYTRPAGSRFWPDPNKPTTTLNPDRIDLLAARAIVSAWGTVKKPGVVTVVIDTSGSMSGEKLEQAKQGTIRMLDNIDRSNRVGLIAFSDAVNDPVPVAPVAENRFAIRDGAQRMRAAGNTALYTALQDAIRMTDDAPADADATRGVVVLTDGKANLGVTLDRVVQVMSRDETPIPACQAFESDQHKVGPCVDQSGARIGIQDILGADLAVETRHPIHVFYVGIGSDADLQIGRILAEATHSAYRASTKDNLASVLETFGKYF
jgi:Ca-activated chloride channel family protein